MNVLVVVPTYNERENIEALVRAVLDHRLPYAPAVMVVDDGSPDGTARVVRAMMKDSCAQGRLFLLERACKRGLADAYIAGFRWGLAHGFDLLIEMDADGSHDPASLPRLIGAACRFDFAIGSRYVEGGAVTGWSVPRRFLSKGGSLFARAVLGSRIRDLTGGFNAWNRAVFERVDLAKILSTGYCFQIELKYRAAQSGLSWTELPVTFKDRVYGRSKMTGRIALEAVFKVLALRRRVTHD